MLILFAISFVAGCNRSNDAGKDEIAALRAELDASRRSIKDLQSQLNDAKKGRVDRPTDQSKDVNGPRLIVVRGLKSNWSYPIFEGDNVVGRADQKPVDIDLEPLEPQDRVWSSRQHAMIVRSGKTLTIEDLNSSNGTYLNRNRVPPGERRPIKKDDVIQIGEVHLKVIE